jgi:hypothetical protein
VSAADQVQQHRREACLETHRLASRSLALQQQLLLRRQVVCLGLLPPQRKLRLEGYLGQTQLHLSLNLVGYLAHLRRLLNLNLGAYSVPLQQHPNLKLGDSLARRTQHLNHNQGACLAPLQPPLNLKPGAFSDLRSQAADYLAVPILPSRRKVGQAQ